MRIFRGWFVALAILSPALLTAETFRVASYNLENYLDQPTESRPHAKSPESKAKIRESIRALKPDILALQEMGTTNALMELRASLKAEGLDLPYWEHITGFDTNIHVSVLSRFPFTARRPHTNETFLLSGRRFHVSRGFAEVDVKISPSYTLTLITAHLKSKRPVGDADEAEQRLEEAKILRRIIEADLTANPKLNLVVLGDLNDTKDSPPIKAIVGRGKHKLIDTRPAEQNGDNLLNPNRAYEPRNVTWTHYYGVEDSYSRLDYLLISPNLARSWITNETYVLAVPNWGLASDHRPIVATFQTEER